MSHIFISYSHTDKDYTRNLTKDLENRGFSVWMDESIDYGDRWFKAIIEAIRKSAAVIVIMTPEAEQSEWVEHEILLAKKYLKQIFPLLLRGAPFDLLISTQYIDVQGNKLLPDNFYQRLAELENVSILPPKQKDGNRQGEAYQTASETGNRDRNLPSVTMVPELSWEELRRFTEESIDPVGQGPVQRPYDNADLTDAELRRRIIERNSQGKTTYLLRFEYERRLRQQGFR